MVLGLKRGTVALAPHDPAWAAEASRTVETLRGILGETAEDIQHVGSTSVKNIAAKPIVDIAAAVNDFDAVLAKRAQLQKAGFFYRPNSDLGEQLLFACGSFYTGAGETQTHFIHVVKAGGRQWRDYINFRDYLNAKPEAAREYEALKLRLAAECPVDAGREHYLAGKQAFIARTLHKALAWSYLGKNVHVVIDRPVGYVHQKESFALVYPVNYGYIPGVQGGDGEELDVYLLGVAQPVQEADCTVIGVVYRENDAEDKLIAAPPGVRFTKEEMAAAVRFQEQWFISRIEEA